MKISEDFYSTQCEGISSGIPSYFVRLTGCNLLCGYKDNKLSGEPTWICDSIPVWKEGTERSNDYLLDRFDKEGQLINILKGDTRIIFTGGEPTISRHVKAIQEFTKYIKDRYNASNIYSEIETNGTFEVPDKFYGNDIQQVNCSPKLSNSGMAKARRINVSALKQINIYDNSQFKFVISNERDICEIEHDFLLPRYINPRKIILMPACDSLEKLSATTRLCMDLTKKYGYRTITRSQILAWDRVTGV